MRINGLKAAILTASLCLWGCSDDKAKSVAPREFYSAEPYGLVSGSAIPPADQNAQPGGAELHTKTPAPQPRQGISEAVKKVVLAPDADPAASQPSEPTTMASTQPAIDPGTYLELGGVAAEVNGKPIFCNDVIRRNLELFRQKARENSRDRFEVAARALIDQGLDELIKNELALAAAQSTLDNQDKQIADRGTGAWRQQQINEAGGSLQLAMRRAQAQGKTFDEMEAEHKRELLIILYYERKIYPRVQITPADMKRYYLSHLSDPSLNLSTHPSAEVLIICKAAARKDPSDLAKGRQMALDDITDLRKQAMKGVDFEGLARKTDMVFPTHMELGASRLEKVEAAAFKVPVGQISDVIEDIGGYYLLKVVSRVEVTPTKPFEDPTVQEKIHAILENSQIQVLHDEALVKLRKDAAIRTTPEMVDSCLQLAMQNYSRWASEKK